MNELITSLENFESVVGVFLDFSKAFDTIDQNYYWISWNIMKLGVMPSYGYNYILYYIYSCYLYPMAPNHHHQYWK